MVQSHHRQALPMVTHTQKLSVLLMEHVILRVYQTLVD